MADDKSYLPDPAHVLHTIDFSQAAHAAAAASNAAPPAFRILRTDELDPYEKKKSGMTIAASALAAAAEGDDFTGKDRRKAKISISNAPVEKFDDLSDLLDSLEKDAKMVKHDPKIVAKDPKSDRVKEEKRNVRVETWLYAASRENDNDFHIILGRDPEESERRYMNAEVSGLPPASSHSRQKIAATRKSFAAIVQEQLPGLGYDFYDPPIAVTVQGSLFFDMTHAKGSKPGPSSVKPKTIWEIHPITNIKPRTT
jgi:hypothetical protein